MIWFSTIERVRPLDAAAATVSARKATQSSLKIEYLGEIGFRAQMSAATLKRQGARLQRRMAERGFRAHMSHPVGGVDRNMQGLGADRVRKFNDLLDAYCDGEIADESYD